jgi:hypothetical protein
MGNNGEHVFVPPVGMKSKVVLAVGGLALVLAPAAFTMPLYRAPYLIANPDPGNTSRNPLVGDFDRDGYLDVVINGSVRHGNHDGTFTEVQSLPYVDRSCFQCNPAASDMEVGDVNGDGWLDLCFLVEGDSLRIHLNDGIGRFGTYTAVYAGSHGRFTLGDVNGDGKLDLIAYTTSMNTRLGNGDGTFGPVATSLPGPASHPLAGKPAVADVNGDGLLDVLVTGSDEPTRTGLLCLFVGNGDNTFQPRLDYDTGWRATSIATGDLNGDGLPDVAVVGVYVVSIYRSNADGTLTPANTVSPSTPMSAMIADFDRDGNGDLAIGSDGANAFSDPKALVFFHGDGNFGFAPSASFDIQHAGIIRGWIGAGHVDSDADLDVIVDNNVLLGNGDGTFGTILQAPTGTAPSVLAITDVNHDGRADVVTDNFAAASISVLLGAGDGSFGSANQFATAPNSFGFVAADMNADTHPDILTIGRVSGSGVVYVHLGTGTGTFPTHVQALAGVPYLASISTGDVNADGKVDVVTGSQEGHFSVLLGNGSGSLALYRTYTLEFTTDFVRDLALADMNGDGKLDIVGSVSPYGTVWRLTMLLGNGDGTFGVPQNSYGSYGMDSGGGLEVADIDQDGDLDIVVSGNYTEVFRNLGNGQLQNPTTVLVGGGAGLVVADFEGDGFLDLAITNDSRVILLFGDGTGAFPRKQAYGCGSMDLTSLAVARVDGNSVPDLVTSHRSGHVRVLLDTSSLLGVPMKPTPRVPIALAGRPNPTRSRVVLELDVPRRSPVTLRVYDLAGRLVRALADGTSEAGRHTVVWDLTDRNERRVPAGLYLCVARDGVGEARSRVVVLN